MIKDDHNISGMIRDDHNISGMIRDDHNIGGGVNFPMHLVTVRER
jgi:hypothetical protein